MNTIPETTIETIDNYVKYGYEPGGFIMAVLTNDLIGAVTKADTFNLAVLKDICLHIYWEIPSNAWGSIEKVENYMKQVRERNNAQVC
jgi:hypothetical protein